MESAVPVGPKIHTRFLSMKQWVQHALPRTISEFGPTPSRRDEHYSPFHVGRWDVSDDIDSFVAQCKDSVSFPIHMGTITMLLEHNDPSEASASYNFILVLKVVGSLLGLDLRIEQNAQARSSHRPHVDATQHAAMLASPCVRGADCGVSVKDRMILVVEMERLAVFRKTVNSDIPNLCLAASEISRPSFLTETLVMFEPVVQFYEDMKRMNLGYGIISSYDLTFLVQRRGDHGQTVYISEGISSTSPKFLGALAYIVDKALKEPISFESGDIKHAREIPPAFASGCSQSLDFQGESKGLKGKEQSPHHGLHGLRTRSHGPVADGLLETPAELLHLAPHHFTTGWSGRIVRGTYEGQRIVVKLAPKGSERAEALLTEVMVDYKLKEFWGKYLPKLILYGTTAGEWSCTLLPRKLMAMKLEWLGSYAVEHGFAGSLSEEVVKEIIDALTVVHQSGILHGDIWPRNTLVAKGQKVGARLIDFGFARPISSNEDCRRELESFLNSGLFELSSLKACLHSGRGHC